MDREARDTFGLRVIVMIVEVQWNDDGEAGATLMFYNETGEFERAAAVTVPQAVMIEELQQIRRLLTPVEPEGV